MDSVQTPMCKQTTPRQFHRRGDGVLEIHLIVRPILPDCLLDDTALFDCRPSVDVYLNESRTLTDTLHGRKCHYSTLFMTESVWTPLGETRRWSDGFLPCFGLLCRDDTLLPRLIREQEKEIQ